MVEKGISWKVGKVFFKEELVYSFGLLPEMGHARPAFINLQQYHVEGFLAERAANNFHVDYGPLDSVAFRFI
jgi:3-(3-hydroxy-phenyl)propionate hydroxylase